MRKVSLDRFTTFGIGGEAEVLTVSGPADCKRIPSQFVTLGNGSNVLIADAGIAQTVVLSRADSFSLQGDRLIAQSGCRLSQLALFTAKLGFSGLEWAYGLPARVGGAVATNAGAFGGCIADCVREVVVFRNGSAYRCAKEDCGFSYRSSRFTCQDFVMQATFDLTEKNSDFCLSEIARVRKGREAQPKGRSAGCIYRTADKSAGWYIERAGLKGKRIGDIVVSPVHAGFFLNEGRGKAADVVRLMDYVEKAVADKFGVVLQREIRLLGDF